MNNRYAITYSSNPVIQDLIQRLLERTLEPQVFISQLLNNSQTISNEEIISDLKNVGNKAKLFDAIMEYLGQPAIQKRMRNFFPEGALVKVVLGHLAYHCYHAEFHQQVPFKETMLYRYYEFCQLYQSGFICIHQREFTENCTSLLIESIEYGDFEAGDFLIQLPIYVNKINHHNQTLFELIVTKKLKAKESQDDVAYQGYAKILDGLMKTNVPIRHLLKDVLLLIRAELTTQQIAHYFSRTDITDYKMARLFDELKLPAFIFRQLKGWLKSNLGNPDDPSELNPFAVAECEAYLSGKSTFCAQILMRGVLLGEMKQTKSYHEYVALMGQVRYPANKLMTVLFYNDKVHKTKFCLLTRALMEDISLRPQIYYKFYRGVSIGSRKPYPGTPERCQAFLLALLALMLAAPNVNQVDPDCFASLWLYPLIDTHFREALTDCLASLSDEQRRKLLASFFEYIEANKDEMRKPILARHQEKVPTVLTEIFKMGLEVRVGAETDDYQRLISLYIPGYQTPTLLSRVSSFFAKAPATETSDVAPVPTQHI